MADARAVFITGPRQVEVRDVVVPPPGVGEVQIHTLYSGISAGTEMNFYRGQAPQLTLHWDPLTRLFGSDDSSEVAYPFTYGYANVGRISQLGKDVDSFAIDDVVFTYRPHQTLNVVPASEIVRIPDEIEPRLGVLNANLNTALNGVLDARPAFGDSVVVFGLGVIGLLVTQLLRRTGPGLLISVDPIQSRRELALRIGADVAIDPNDGAAERIHALTEKRGADVVIEVSGSPSALNDAIRSSGFGGRVVAMSWYTGKFDNLSLAGEFHHNRVRLISSQVAAVNPELGPLWDTKRRQQIVTKLLGELQLGPLFTHDFPLEHAGEAYAAVDRGNDGLVQCCLTYDT